MAARDSILKPQEQISKLGDLLRSRGKGEFRFQPGPVSNRPREKVASLSGDAWLEFLNTSAGEDLFRDVLASCIEELALRSSSLSSEEEQAVRHVAATWIRRHRVQA